jgi:hypothetical protein
MWRFTDREADLLLLCLQIQLLKVDETAFEHEVRHAARKLCGLVGVAAEATVSGAPRRLTTTRFEVSANMAVS